MGLRNVLNPSTIGDGTPPNFAVSFVRDGLPVCRPFICQHEAESEFRLQVSHGRAVSIVNLWTYHSTTIDGRD